MTQKTSNYNLEKYDATDAPNLQGEYNRSMDILDTTLKTQSDRIDAIPTPESLPEGLKAFTTALGRRSERRSARHRTQSLPKPYSRIKWWTVHRQKPQ